MNMSNEDMLVDTLPGKAVNNSFAPRRSGKKRCWSAGGTSLSAVRASSFRDAGFAGVFDRMECSAWPNLHDSEYHSVMHAAMKIQAHG